MEAPLSARAALLQALVIPGYGVELIERVRRATGGLVRMGMGSVYPALSRLETTGLVRSRVVRERRRAGRPRRYYELTLRGVAASDSVRRAVAGLFRVEENRLHGEAAERIGQRLRRCSSVSASVLDLRRRVLGGHDGG